MRVRTKTKKSFVENSRFSTGGAQLDARALVESIVSLLTDEFWSTCPVVVKELSHLLIHNVFTLHQYVNELRENEWIGEKFFFLSFPNFLLKIWA